MKKLYLEHLNISDILNRLKKGEKIKSISNKDSFYYMCDNMICCNDQGKIYLNVTLPVSTVDLYFEERKPISLQTGKAYKSKCGHKIFINYDDEHNFYGVIEGIHNDYKVFCWNKDGTTELRTDKDFTIVSEWEE